MEQNQSFIGIHKDIMEFPILDKLKVDNLQSSNEKSEEDSVATWLKGEIIKLSAVKYQAKSFVMLGGAETRWRPKTRA